jgi:PAS domain S-box-containing protein
MASRHSRVEKKFILAVALTTGAILVVGVVLTSWNVARVRAIVADQFSSEQLSVGRSISRAIESELRRLRKELLLLRAGIASGTGGYAEQWESVNACFPHVIESGVQKIEIVDFETARSHVYLPRGPAVAAEPGGMPPDLDLAAGRVTVFQADGTSAMRHLTLVTPLGDDRSAAVAFHLNLSWFLPPLVNRVRSGKTGYSWIIDDSGFFVFHPVIDFVGKNAFTARKEKRGDISYEEINFIQKEKMMTGAEGTGWYTTGWHRGHVGKTRKLVAYCPIRVSDDPSPLWSLAVAAPIAEIEGVVLNAILIQFLILGLVVAVVLVCGSGVLFFEVRWSRLLESRVGERTEALKRSEEKYRSLVESAEDFIYTLDADGNFTSMNSYTADFFGMSAEEAQGKRLSALFADNPEGRQLEMVNLVFRHGKSARREIELRIGDHAVWLSANYMPLRETGGKVAGVLCIARDITENKNLERKLIETEKLASLGVLAAGIAHEINNPIGIILGFCDLLLRKTPADTQAYDDLKTIERQALACEGGVKNLLNLSRTEEAPSVNCDLHACLEDIIKVVRHTLEMKQIRLATSLDETLPPVRADCRQLQQVFLNLINNAAFAMPDGGCLDISAAQDRSGKNALVVIADTGQGIRESDLERIYDPFFTTKAEREGTGLGLFVSYGIITRYGGTIECRSSTGDGSRERGTAFTIRLPLSGR